MKLKFCGAAKTVTGSCYYIDTGELKFLVDCGAYQGSRENEAMNYEAFPFNPADLDFVFLTHAHFDHCGRLPVLVKQGFHGRIVCTQPTRDLAKVVLLDAAHIQAEDYERWTSRAKEGGMTEAEVEEESFYTNRKPLFTIEDVEAMAQLFEVYPYSTSVNINNHFEFRLRDAGHIIGSASIEFWVKNEAERTRKIVFSGDLGQPGARIVKDPDLIREADYVICESTYGNRIHRDRNETLLELLAILQAAQKNEGNVLIPVFAIERTQEILYEVNLFVEQRLLSGLPIYLDSPMASKATAIFKQYPDFYDEDAKRLLNKGDDPFEFPGLHIVEDAEESKRLISKRGIVIMAGSGMCTGGRIMHHLKNNIENAKTHIVFVGYQVKGTLGRRIVDGERMVRIFGREYENNAKVHTLGGFSAHGDERDLSYWLGGFGQTPKQIFIVHGDEQVAEEFADRIYKETHIETIVPNLDEEFELK
ncbi:TPA: MBL fold hydrolase [Patescibacteria group bacterium]|nr:MBL fold hydrolase [Patescibacteria group bacterium]